MKLCNETITLFNARFDEANDRDIYVGTVISGVSWYCEIASAVVDSGLKAASRYTVRIPEDADFSGKTYVDPIAYVRSDPETTFTLKSGDLIVKGAIEAESTEIRSLYNIADNIFARLVDEDGNNIISEDPSSAILYQPAALQELYPEMITILGVTDNRRAPNAKHWKVVGA